MQFMVQKVDLHTHTTHSDGFHSPEELIKIAKSRGIRAVSITDHDAISAYTEAHSFGKKIGVEVIPGVELSIDIGGSEVHILGYLFNPKDKDLKAYLKFFYPRQFLVLVLNVYAFEKMKNNKEKNFRSKLTTQPI